MKTIETVSKYRNQIMGLAILWIILFHTGMSLPFPLSQLKQQGFGGTDIFIFLSGFGLYYSLKKDNNPIEFYKRRLTRVLPAYIPFVLACFAGILYKGLPELKASPFSFFQAFCGNLTLMGRFNGLDYQTNWYMPAIIWFYFFTPVIYHLISEYKGKKRTVNIILIFIFTALINITFFGNRDVLVGVSRIFVFILGILFADMRNKNISEKLLIVLPAVSLAVGIVLVFLFRQYRDVSEIYGINWYPYILIAPSLTILSGKLFSLLDSFSVGKAVNSFFSFIGKTSYEIFLVHLFLFTIIEALIKNRTGILFWIAASAVGIGSGIAYHFIIEFIMKKFSGNKTASK